MFAFSSFWSSLSLSLSLSLHPSVLPPSILSSIALVFPPLFRVSLTCRPSLFHSVHPLFIASSCAEWGTKGEGWRDGEGQWTEEERDGGMQKRNGRRRVSVSSSSSCRGPWRGPPLPPWRERLWGEEGEDSISMAPLCVCECVFLYVLTVYT